jgi:hypothetical protein
MSKLPTFVNRTAWTKRCAQGLTVVALMAVSFAAFARQDLTSPKPTTAQDEQRELVELQKKLAEDYRLLEEKLFALYEVEMKGNPERSQLLQRAFQASKQQKTLDALRTIVAALEQSKYSDAETGQKKAMAELEILLSLLQNEDAGNRMRDAVKRNLEYLKEVERLQRVQRSLRNELQSVPEPTQLKPAQDNLAERANKLENQIRKNEETPASDSETPVDPSTEPQDQPPKADGQPPSGDAQPSGLPPTPENSAPSKGRSQTPQSGDENQPAANPIRQRIEAAQQRMREATKKLEEANKDDAREQMQLAEKELAEAKRQLEEILRQMREEEKEYVLAMLEERFRAMLERQLRVNEQTQRIDKTDLQQRLADFEIACRKLSGDEREILLEADRALSLLREEGSSVALPETTAQMREDMAQVVDRLASFETGTVTQDIEQDIAETLGYFVAALAQAKKDLEREKQSPGQQSGGGAMPGEQPLVNAIAELKLVRSLQDRVYRRHQRYSMLLENPNDQIGRAEKADLREAIGRLSGQQKRLVEVTREIELKARSEK